MHFVERVVPVTVRNPERSRRGLYRLSDPFLRFWFRFVLPNRTALIEPHLAQHTSGAFEEAAREHLLELNRRGALPAVYDRIGGWWRGSAEVDVVAVAYGGPLLVGECKWPSRPVGPEVLRALEAKVPAVQADLKRSPTRIDLALFSRSGFTEELRQEARGRAMLIYEVEDMLG